ncbi:SET and MYND domain-containing protein 3 [Cricetulus griseus]|nr:SET and MYND domain-containing protein 3 [Cricetulus griseus]
MRCSQCRIAKYCSAKCQKKAWPDHKQECKCLKSCKPRYPPDSVRLLARVIVKLMDEKPSESEKLYSFYDLESNIQSLASRVSNYVEECCSEPGTDDDLGSVTVLNIALFLGYHGGCQLP